jgi:hypothetical protein
MNSDLHLVKLHKITDTDAADQRIATPNPKIAPFFVGQFQVDFLIRGTIRIMLEGMIGITVG